MDFIQLPVLMQAGSASVLGGVALLAVRHRQEPGALPFAVLMLSLLVWTGGYAVALVTPDGSTRMLLEAFQWLGTATLHLWLLLFTLAYTGYDRYVTRQTVALLLVPPALSVVAFVTNGWHHLMFTKATVVVQNGLVLVDYSYAAGFWAYTLYSYSFVLVSFALLVRLIFVSDYLYADQSALLGAGIVMPLAINVADVVFLEPYVTVDVTPIGLSITGFCFGYALFRHQLFDLVPATRQLGRQVAIGQLDTGIVIVDNDNRVVYANRAAGDIFDCEPAEALGRKARSFVDDDWLDFGSEDALAEVERDDRTYEIRTSSITDRHGREIGHTLVVHDVTARKRRERELAAKREELTTVNDLNAVIRGVNQALVSATSREEIERAVADRLAEAELYDGVCIADVQTWTGEADRWRVAGDGLVSEPADPADGGIGPAPPEIDAEHMRSAGDTADEAGPTLPTPASEDEATNWIVVPVVYGRTVYGAIGLLTERSAVTDRERSVLGELGELVGHAVNAVESQRLFGAEGVVELRVAVGDGDDPVAGVTAGTDARIDVLGIVPRSGDGHLAFLEVTGESVETVRERFAAEGIDARIVREDGDDGLVEITVDETTSLAPVVASDAHLLQGTVAGGQATYDVLVPSMAEGRTLLDRLSAGFASTDLRSKRERDHPFEEADGVPPERLADLTDRQREALEAAFRAGYFEWPRDADAEEVATSMDITSPTLHAHLRKAQRTLLEDLFDPPGDR